MNYRKKCGNELKPGQEFCTNCGETVEFPELSHDINTKQRSQNKQPTFLNKKGFWILAIIIVILLAALFVGYKIYDSKNHPSKIVQEFENAIEQKDTKKVVQLLNSGQDEMEVKEGKILLNYYEAHPDIYADTIQLLREEAVALEDNELMVTKKKKNVFLSIKETENKWLLFNQYGLSFKPVYFKITVNQPEVSITLNDQKQGDIKKGEKKTLGPFLPIEHEIIGTYKGKYGSATVKEVINPSDYDEKTIPVELDVTGNEVSLSSNYDDAIVFINGESTGKTVNDLSTVGPVLTDGTVKIHAEVTQEGHKLKSEEVAVTEEDQSIRLYIDDSIIEKEKEHKEEAARNREQEIYAVEEAVYSHYHYIGYDYYSSAYDLFSSGRKQKVNYEKWKEGLLNNIDNDVTKVVVDSLDGDKAVASFEMTSRDYQDDGSILVQKFGGKWKLIKEFSGWKLLEPETKKLDQWIE